MFNSNSIERDIEYWNKLESMMKKLVTMYQQCTDTFELWNRQILFDTSRICILKTPLLIVRYNNYDIELIRTSEKYVVYYFSPLQSLVSNIVIQANYLKRCTCFIHCIEKIVVLFYIEALPSWYIWLIYYVFYILKTRNLEIFFTFDCSIEIYRTRCL